MNIEALKEEDIEQTINLILEQYETEEMPASARNELAALYLININKLIREEEYTKAIKGVDELTSLNYNGISMKTYDKLLISYNTLIRAANNAGLLSVELLDQLFYLLAYFPKTLPSPSYSALVRTLLHLDIPSVKFIEYIDTWGLDNFMPQDYCRQYRKGQSKSLSALAAKVYSRYAEALLDGIPDPQSPFKKIYDENAIDCFLPELEGVCQRYSDFDIPRFYLAKLLHARGRTSDAKRALLSFLREHKNAFSAWILLSALEEYSSELIFNICAKAFFCPGAKPEQKLKILQYLAQYLLEEERYEEAKAAYYYLINYYKRNAWALPLEYMNILEEPPLSGYQLQLEKYLDYLKEAAKEAEHLLFEDIPAVIAVVEHHNTAKSIVKFRVSREQEGIFKLDAKTTLLSPGDLIKARLTPLDSFKNKLESLELIEEETPEKHCPSYKEAEGVLCLLGNGSSGFVEDCYLPASLIRKYELQGGDLVKLKAIEMYNDKMGKWTWVAVKIAD